MADGNLTVPPRVCDLDPGDVTLEAELVDKDAEREIDKAVRGRRGIARKYVKWVRRRNPDATPAEIISMLEHHYVTAISVAGAAITVGRPGSLKTSAADSTAGSRRQPNTAPERSSVESPDSSSGVKWSTLHGRHFRTRPTRSRPI